MRLATRSKNDRRLVPPAIARAHERKAWQHPQRIRHACSAKQHRGRPRGRSKLFFLASRIAASASAASSNLSARESVEANLRRDLGGAAYDRMRKTRSAGAAPYETYHAEEAYFATPEV